MESKEVEALGTIKNEEKVAEMKTFNGIPHLLQGSVFGNCFKVADRVGWDDNIGATYFVFPMYSNKELVLRIDSCDRKTPSNLFVEAALLKLAEAKNRYNLFTQFHSYDLTAKYPWLAVYYRGGPGLNECINFLENKSFSHGSAGRFACDILAIMEFVHENAFLMTKLDMDILSIDPCSRHVFLSNMGYVKVNPNKRQLRIKQAVKWSGFADYAPLSYHGNAQLTQWDELEAFFYMLYEMTVGTLPWGGQHLSVVEHKKLLFAQEDNFNVLPLQYLNLWDMIVESKKNECNDYSALKEKCKEIYETIGGITDLDQNYDFEVDFPDLPEEDLPRFVLEKTLIESDGDEENQELVLDDTQEIEEDKDIEGAA